MKLFKYLMPAMLACGIAATASATEFSSVDEFNERDFEAVTDFIKSKRMVPLADKGCDLHISGDIRAEWENIKEKHDGVNLRGRNANNAIAFGNCGAPYGDNQFDVEFNLMFDYQAGCTWAVAHIEFDNNAGIDVNRFGCYGMETSCLDSNSATANMAGDPVGCHGSGTCENLCLRKAYFGYNIFEECGCRLDVEVGRRHLFDVFDSRVQFRSRFDGVLFRYSNEFECVGDFYVNGGAFVIDESVDHFGYVVEAGLLDICDYGVDLKYSYIDWSVDCNRCNRIDPRGMEHGVHQFTMAYNFDPEWLCSRAKVYGAFLWNHKAKRYSEFNNDKADMGWYLGFMVGDVRCEGDWSFDVNYQWVEAGVIPDCDLTGIGRGNARGVPITQNVADGNLNYKGWRAEFLYALTDNLGVNPSWEYSTDNKRAIGGDHTYSKWELQFIYAF